MKQKTYIPFVLILLLMLVYLRNLLHIIILITHLYGFYEYDTVTLPKHHSYYTAVIHRNVCVM